MATVERPREEQKIIVKEIIPRLIKAFLFQAFWIPTGSMEPTLVPGDRVIVAKVPYYFHDPQRGDVIVFQPPNRADPVIHRIASLRGGVITTRGLRHSGWFVGNGSVASVSSSAPRKLTGGSRGTSVTADGASVIAGNGVSAVTPALLTTTPIGPASSSFAISTWLVSASAT